MLQRISKSLKSSKTLKNFKRKRNMERKIPIILEK
jgi:hypothetical protein